MPIPRECLHACAPDVFQSATGDALDIDLREPARARVEPRREDEDVVFVLRRRRAHAGGNDLGDRIVTDVDQRDVVLVEHLEIPLLQRRPLRTKGVRWFHRRELVGDGTVIDASAGLVAPELVGELVRVAVQDDVAEGAGPEVEAALLPRPLELRNPFVDGNLEGRPLVGHDVEQAAVRQRALAEPLGIVRLHRTLLRRRRTVAGASAAPGWACAGTR